MKQLAKEKATMEPILCGKDTGRYKAPPKGWTNKGVPTTTGSSSTTDSATPIPSTSESTTYDYVQDQAMEDAAIAGLRSSKLVKFQELQDEATSEDETLVQSTLTMRIDETIEPTPKSIKARKTNK